MSTLVSKGGEEKSASPEAKLTPTQLAILRAKEARAAREALEASAAAKLEWAASERAKLAKVLDKETAEQTERLIKAGLLKSAAVGGGDKGRF